MTVFTLSTSWQKLLEKVEYDRDVVLSLPDTVVGFFPRTIYLRLGDEGPVDIKWQSYVSGTIMELHIPKQTSLWGRINYGTKEIALLYKR